MSKLFITAIDTDAGKTIITGLLAKYFLEKGKKVITQKIAQTGCKNSSEDIEMHRKIMQLPMQEADKKGYTCPYIFNYPASPHLAASMEKQEIVPEKIIEAANYLEKQYETVIMEGVGGLMVPLTENYTVLDFIVEHCLDTVLVTNAKLGSINHSLLTLKVMEQKKINLKMLIYNKMHKEESEITKDTERFLKEYLNRHFPEATFVSVPFVYNNFPTYFFEKASILNV